MKGRALVDIPALKIKCGEYCDIPDADAKRYIEIGAFDPRAVEQRAVEQKEEKRKPK